MHQFYQEQIEALFWLGHDEGGVGAIFNVDKKSSGSLALYEKGQLSVFVGTDSSKAPQIALVNRKGEILISLEGKQAGGQLKSFDGQGNMLSFLGSVNQTGYLRLFDSDKNEIFTVGNYKGRWRSIYQVRW